MPKLKTLLLLCFTFLLIGCTLSVKVLDEKILPILEKESGQTAEDDQFYYFGYGSNMDLDTMKQRCGEENFTNLSKATLEDYTFYFYGQGFANIKPQSNSQVEGVLHKINNNCLRALDRVEGYPDNYQRKEVEVNYQKENILAQVYIVLNDETTGKPSQEYFQRIIQAANKNNFSAEYIEKITALGQ